MTKRDRREDIGQHLAAMRAFALSLTQDPSLADDMVQDAVVKAWVKFDTYEDGTNLRAWLFAILRNTFLSHVRKRKLDPERLDDISIPRHGVWVDREGTLAFRDFMKVFRTLSLEQRETLLLVGALGFTYEEAAEVCAVPTGTIKSRANRARKALAERLEIDMSG